MPKQQSNAVSIADIAKRAGVSKSTVSRALNNNPTINIKTREKVQAIARELKYRVNTGARNLRLQRSQTISVVINSDLADGQKLSDPFMIDMISAIADELNTHHYSLLFSGPSIARANWHSHFLGSRRSDGIIVIGQGKNDEPLRKMQEQGGPIVVWGAHMPEINYCVVGSDNYDGGRKVARHLVEQGRKHIVFLGDTDHPEVRARFRGYSDALGDAGLLSDKHHVEAAFSIESGFAQMMGLIKDGAKMDGIFAASDHIAMGAIKALQETGLRVPEDVSVVGFDDIQIASYFSPSLTTVKQDIHNGGKLLVQKMMALLAGQKASCEVLEPKLIVRSS